MRWARILGRLGRALIGTGVLLLLFVAYQLWGTGLQEARAQDRLTRDFEEAIAATAPAREPTPARLTPTTAPPPPPAEGDPVAVMEIPAIGLTRTIVEGVGVDDLKQGPGHYPGTPLPGQAGNAAIAGHRTTYGAPFYRLNELEPGDEIELQTLQGEFTYEVTRKHVVSPDQVEVLDPTEDAQLTLTTCEPRFSARQRLIIVADLLDEPEPAPTTTTTTTTTGGTGDGDDVPAVATLDDPAGLSGDPAARWPTFWWALATALVGLAIWQLGRWWRPAWAYLLGAVPFLVVLFVFYENVSRLLPANV
jgi:sortase A